MDKKKAKKLEKVTSAVAQSSAGLSFIPFCTIILHQPPLPQKLQKEIIRQDYENCHM